MNEQQGQRLFAMVLNCETMLKELLSRADDCSSGDMRSHAVKQEAKRQMKATITEHMERDREIAKWRSIGQMKDEDIARARLAGLAQIKDEDSNVPCGGSS